jgi:hypothetical protein
MSQNRKTLRDQLTDHYEAQQLRPEKLAVLTALARERRGARWVVPAMAAGILMAAVVLATINEDRSLDVAREIAMNHERALQPDIVCESYETLLARMGKLDFAPREPERLAGGDYTLIGARYCSLLGNIAVQLRLQDKDGRNLTLYQARDGDAFDNVRATETRLDGIRIQLWREGGLIVGLAGGN